MENCKIERARVLCKECQMLYGFDVQSSQEGFRGTKCPHCGQEQLVWIEFKVIVVPVPKDIKGCD